VSWFYLIVLVRRSAEGEGREGSWKQ